MTRAHKITLGVLSIVACSTWLVILSIGSHAYQTWSEKPLGPTLAYPTEWQLPATWTALPAAEAATDPAITLSPALATETQTPASPFLACNHNLPNITV